MVKTSVIGSTIQKWLAILAFGIIYFVWGANFVAILFAIDSIPPFFMAGTRFFAAGLLIYLWVRLKGETHPSLRASTPSAVQGVWLNVLGTGGLVWSEQYVPSGLAAIMLSTVPVWMVVLDRDNRRRNFRNPFIVAGLGLGVAAVALLSDYNTLGYLSNNSNYFYLGLTVLMLATVCWAKGSLYSKSKVRHVSLAMDLAIQMLTAGILLFVTGLTFGEQALFSLSAITRQSLMALAFLIICSSVIGYLAYLWLLDNYSPTLVGTYAYVHPVVAIVLGWGLVSEPITVQTIISMTMVLGAVFLIKYAHSGNHKIKFNPISKSYDSANMARNCPHRKG